MMGKRTGKRRTTRESRAAEHQGSRAAGQRSSRGPGWKLVL